eukprot:g4268.t2
MAREDQYSSMQRMCQASFKPRSPALEKSAAQTSGVLVPLRPLPASSDLSILAKMVLPIPQQPGSPPRKGQASLFQGGVVWRRAMDLEERRAKCPLTREQLESDHGEKWEDVRDILVGLRATSPEAIMRFLNLNNDAFNLQKPISFDVLAAEGEWLEFRITCEGKTLSEKSRFIQDRTVTEGERELNPWDSAPSSRRRASKAKEVHTCGNAICMKLAEGAKRKRGPVGACESDVSM